jgi:hypothetical protein
VKTPEEVIAENFLGFFDVAIRGECLDAAQDQLSRSLQEVGVQIYNDNDKNYYNSLKALIDALNTPGMEKCKLEEIIEVYISSVSAWVRSQPGLETFPDCELLERDPIIKEFYELHLILNEFSRNIAKNPAAASFYFNAEAARAFGRAGVLFGAMATRVREMI